MAPVRVFISYAWEDDAYRFWVQRLAVTLRSDGIDARLDAWHRQTGQDFPSFMNSEIRNADRVLVLGSPSYRIKVHSYEDDGNASGAGWEAMLLTAQVFGGHRSKIAVAVARGMRRDALPDWLHTQPCYDLTIPDDQHGYEILKNDLKGELPAPPPIGETYSFASYEVTPLFARPPSMEVTLELRRWFDTRWPEGKPDAIYAPWSDFEAGRVVFPEDLIHSVVSSLEITSRSLVVGRSASGKSVLAASIAFEWSRITGRRAFWLDFGDQSDESPDAMKHDIKTFLTLGGANLLVIDNIQVAPRVADWAVTQLENAQRNCAGEHRLLLLSRPSLSHVRHEANLEDRLALQTTVISPDAKIFAAVAERLRHRLGLTRVWTTTDYEQFVNEFGADLICFGQAILCAGSTGMPTRRLAASRVRNAYIDPARRHGKGVALLSRLCAATTLDLTATDSALDGSVLQAIPHLVDGGHVQTLEKGNYRHWKLAHPGMGSLILETLAVDKGCSEADIRHAALLDLVRSCPYMVGPVTARIANSAYGYTGFLTDWSKLLLSQPTTLKEFFAIDPCSAVRVDRLLPHLVSWVSLDDSKFREKVIASLKRMAPHFVVAFLRYAEHYKVDAAKDLLSNLLKDSDFRAHLRRQSPEHVALFLRYAEKYKENDARDLLNNLIQDADFRALLGRKRPLHVASFLRYAEKYEPDAAKDLLSNLLKDTDFRDHLRRQPPEHVAPFRRYAEKYKDKDNDARDLLNNLIQDTDFRALLGRATPSKVIGFLWYAKRHFPVATMMLLEELLQIGDFRAQLASTSPNFVKLFQK
jgi:hypothetical protein